MNNLFNTTKRYPVIVFYILAFVISWFGWIPQALHNRGLSSFNNPLFNILGGISPAVAAIIVILLIREKDGLRKLFGAIFKLRLSFWWYIFVFVFWFVVAAVALGFCTVFSQTLPSFSKFSWISLVPIFITMMLSNVWEEIGWRGFALPRFQERFGDLKIVFIMGLLWSAWHLPLILNSTSSMANLPWYGEIIFSLSLTVIYTWLYEHTNRSLFFVSIFHAMSNTVAFILLQLDVFESTYLFVVCITAIIAIAIILIYGSQRFIKAPLISEGI